MDINTLRNVRKCGQKLEYEDRLRLAVQDSRVLKELRCLLIKAAIVLAIVCAMLFCLIGRHTQYGCFTPGGEVLFPLAAIFAYWVWKENR